MLPVATRRLTSLGVGRPSRPFRSTVQVSEAGRVTVALENGRIFASNDGCLAERRYRPPEREVSVNEQEPTPVDPGAPGVPGTASGSGQDLVTEVSGSTPTPAAGVPGGRAAGFRAAGSRTAGARGGARVAGSHAASERTSGRRVVGKRRGKPKRGHTVLMWLLSTTLVLALVTGLGVVFAYRHLQGNITVDDPFKALDNRPQDYDTGPKKALTILVMGLDTREGDNAVDGESGMNGSDTTILLHVSADRSRAYGISIPRDSMVERPACGDNDEIPGAKYAQWDVAYSRGGAACTVEQFELNTGVRVDETITVDFSGFKGMVNAIGGVPMCVPYDIRDPKTKAFIPKGEREMKGQEALDYVRLRYIGTGSDIDRITRQQTFVASMVNKTVSKGTLARVDKVYKFLNAATKSLTVSEGLSDLTQLAKLGVSLNGVGLDQIQFLTVPNEPWVENPNRIAWTEDAATLWKKIGKDKPLTAEFTGDAIKADKGQTSEAPAPSTSSSPSASPSASAGPQEGESEASEAEQAADREQARREAEAKGLCG